MKYIGVAEAKAQLSKYIEAAQGEPVIVLSHGKPAAMLVGLEGLSLEQVTSEDVELLKVLAERAKPGRKTVPWNEVRGELLARVERGSKKQIVPAKRSRTR